MNRSWCHILGQRSESQVIY